MPRTRSRRPGRVSGSKRRTRKTQNIPSEIQAPITNQVERHLEQLVAQFGEKQVLDALDTLIMQCKWNDWQCVANAIRRIARHKEQLTSR